VSNRSRWQRYSPRDRNPVATEMGEPQSLLNYYMALIQLRRKNASLREGEFQPVDAGPDVVAWVSKSGADAVLVVLNFSVRPKTVSIPVKITALQKCRPRRSSATALIPGCTSPSTVSDVRRVHRSCKVSCGIPAPWVRSCGHRKSSRYRVRCGPPMPRRTDPAF
jgi:hypothetical protein